MRVNLTVNLERKVLLMKKSRLILILIVTTFFLSACDLNLAKPLSNKKATQEFNKNTICLMNVHRYNLAKKGLKTKESKGFNKYFDKKVVFEKGKVEKSSNFLKKSNKYSSYSKDIYRFNRAVLAYIKSVQLDKLNEVDKKKQKSLYHNATLAAIKAKRDLEYSSENQKLNEEIKGYVSSIASYDNFVKKRKVYKMNKPNHSIASKTKNTQTSQVDISLGPGIILLIITVLLITTIFLQPNKSEDNGYALIDNSQHPSLRGYDLLVNRSTAILIVMLVIILLILNRK